MVLNSQGLWRACRRICWCWPLWRCTFYVSQFEVPFGSVRPILDTRGGVLPTLVCLLEALSAFSWVAGVGRSYDIWVVTMSFM